MGGPKPSTANNEQNTKAAIISNHVTPTALPQPPSTTPQVPSKVPTRHSSSATSAGPKPSRRYSAGGENGTGDTASTG